MSAHTKGPWKAWQRDSDKGTNYWAIRAAPDAFGLQGNLRGYCGEANAHLIAAAPDLLEALERCDPGPEWEIPDRAHDGRVFCELSVGDMKAIRAAIAKAKGEQP